MAKNRTEIILWALSTTLPGTDVRLASSSYAVAHIMDGMQLDDLPIDEQKRMIILYR